VHLTFDFPIALRYGLPLVLLALGGGAWAHWRGGMAIRRVALLTALRAVALLWLTLLAGRPTWVSTEPAQPSQRHVVLLMDGSESMAIEEGDQTRYQQALGFSRQHLLPALKAAGLEAQALLFAETAEPADGAKLASTPPKGRRTNLAGAIARAVAGTPTPPVAVIALTDGIVNENADNARALAALVENRVPFIGVGFGSDQGARTLSLRSVDAPSVVSTNTLFRITAELEVMSPDEMPAFDLLLLREGKVVQQKTVQPGKGARLWLENFQVSEPAESICHYTVQFLPPAAPGLKCASTTASVSVQISSEKELRVLYVQGALTWDYKFATWALKGDPAIKLTGLTRTSKQSIFRQNVESADELARGFPISMEELTPFRVVVLANLAPADLSSAQQELLARFCSECGGGLLMIGGPATFHAAWLGSRLEQVLPVTFSAQPGVLGLDRPFHFRPTEDALQHPLFQLASDRSAREIWAQMPTFSQYGRVQAAKPGAQIWAEHPEDEGPNGKRILMASQRYGAGVSAVICVQNLWRWRLARECDPQHFDRFWRQLLHFLSEPSRQEVLIHLADQDLHPHTDVRVSVEKKPAPGEVSGAALKYTLRVETEGKKLVAQQALDLVPGRPVDTSFPADDPGLYRMSVTDAGGKQVGMRTLEIRDLNLEFQETARNLETLRQWAALTAGLALKMEDCPGGEVLVEQIKKQIEGARRFKPIRRPAGVNAWALLLVLGSLGSEWWLRKQWRLL
jgi:uncharacterized membrane protein